jgi:dihydrolipoamide dehydrogenase
VIGVGFASLWASLGSTVTMIESLPRLLPNDDSDSVTHLARVFRRRKIQARTGATVTDVEQDSAGVTVTFDTGSPLTVDYLLVAVGRRPRTDNLGLETVDVKIADRFVETDLWLETTEPGVYAVGNIVAGPQLAHRSFQQGMFVAEELAGQQPTTINDVAIPRITYSHAEVAAAG